MYEVDKAKLSCLIALWLEHERWIQNGCLESGIPRVPVPGYLVLAEQDVLAYALYRHSLVPYLAESRGFPGVHEDLGKLLADSEGREPSLLRQLLAEFGSPNHKFRAQWGNLFDTVFHDGLTHKCLHNYQQKFEVELPICFLAHLRQIVTSKSLDLDLTRFRDSAGNLRKGVLAQYAIDGLSRYPALKGAAQKGYRPRLRNAIGHNSYTISDREIRALDGNLSMTEQEFLEAFCALQVVQNAVLCSLISMQHDFSTCRSRGVLSVGWVQMPETPKANQQLVIFQLAPFFKLTTSGDWLDKITLSNLGDKLATVLGDSSQIEGPVTADIALVLNRIKMSGQIDCLITPVMPCVHQHESHRLIDGDYCQVGDHHEKTIQATLAT